MPIRAYPVLLTALVTLPHTPALDSGLHTTIAIRC